MLNTDKFSFWILPHNIANINEWLNSDKKVTRGRKPLAEKRSSNYYTYAEPVNNLYNKEKADKRNQRDQEFVYLYTKEAKTLQEIGEIYGITRERVRQRLKVCGYAGEIGGSSLKSVIKKIHKLKPHKNEVKCLNWYGCSKEIRDAFGHSEAKGTLTHAYKNQKNSANFRNIEWNLTLPEWVEIWKESGHFESRGKGRNNYVMSRFCDTGGYSKNNVIIKSHSENSREARDMDEVRGRWQPIKYNGVIYRSLHTLCLNYNVNTDTTTYRLKQGISLDIALSLPITKNGKKSIKSIATAGAIKAIEVWEDAAK